VRRDGVVRDLEWEKGGVGWSVTPEREKALVDRRQDVSLIASERGGGGDEEMEIYHLSLETCYLADMYGLRLRGD
jgi:hypothetical protein